MAMPFMRAASKTLVPAGTRTDWPSRLMPTKPGGVVAVVILGANADALGFAGARGGGEADAAGTLALQHVGVDFGAKMFDHGLNRRRVDLAEAADRGVTHGLREFVEEGEIGAILRFGYAALRPAREHVRHFLRADTAGDTFAARFIAIKTHGVEGHVQHAGAIVTNHDGARAEHGASFGQRFEIETNIDHRSGKIPGRWTGWREGFQLTAATNAASMIEDNVAHGRTHGDFENARAGDVAAHTDKFQSARTTASLGGEPIHSASENLRNVDESFNVIDDRGFLPQSNLAGKRWLVARLGPMAFDGFDERAFFAEDFFLKMIFVADIKYAAFRAGDEAGDDHAFDEEMRKVGHDEAVFDGAGLAFVRVAHDIFNGIGLLAHQVPFQAGGKTGAAHAFQFGCLQFCEDIVPGFGLNELARDAVIFVFAIGIGFAGDACLLGMRLANVVAADGAAGDLLGTRGVDVRQNVIVDGNRGSVVAASETGNVANLNVVGTRINEPALEAGAQLASAVEMAAHVGTDANFGFRRRREIKMGIETCDAVNLV